MEIIEYDPKYRQAFIDFNSKWITDNFGHLEDGDVYSFKHIEDDIARGAMIYFAVEDGEALAACMAKPMEGTTWEICKMGSHPEKPHKGCGRAVFEASVNWAASHGAKRLFIISNSRLKPALRIYEEFGFKEIKLDDYGYDRGDIAFEKLL
ncbi:MAG: GNAT family N-acetyltransferase [Clostridia bacterium]|nr:GNAT family N-acetyltransferase [Clostridia bacterium]MBQ1434662.1 GNAT family N-acetyltransferase [Clostridia bacterium]